MEIQTELRNAGLPQLVVLLQQQSDVKYDVVVPASKIKSVDGVIHIVDGAVRFDENGATSVDARLAATDIFDDGVADRLGIPRAYVRRLRNEHIGLYDENVNGWLERDGRSFLVRGFRTDDPDAVGIARSLNSDRFKRIDNLDTLLAALDGIRKAGVEVEIAGADLSERRLNVKVVAPQVQAYAEELLKGYRSPFNHGGGDLPIVFAGFVISNSETGGGAFTITPRIVVQVCKNGLTLTKDALREVHLGGKLDAGIVQWSDETQERSLELVKAKTVDAVRTFLSVDYVKASIAKLEEKSGKPVDEPIKAVERLAKSQSWSEKEAESILTFFLSGGQSTAGGLVNAVTAAAQVVDSPDRAYDLEASAVGLLELV